MSNEPTGLLERHIEKMGIAYPIAKVKGETADRTYGVKGFPSGALLDAKGRVVWTGHPGSVSHEQIAALLEDTAFVSSIPGSEHKKINKLITAQDFGKAQKAILKGLGKSPDDEALIQARDDIQGLLQRKLKSAEALAVAGDFGGSIEIYGELQTLFKGSDSAKQAKAEQKTLEKNPAAKADLGAWKMMQKGNAAQRAGDFEKAAKVYRKVIKKYGDTPCAGRAQEFMSRHSRL